MKRLIVLAAIIVGGCSSPPEQPILYPVLNLEYAEQIQAIDAVLVDPDDLDGRRLSHRRQAARPQQRPKDTHLARQRMLEHGWALTSADA